MSNTTTTAPGPEAPKPPPSKVKAVLMFIYILVMIFYTIFGLVQAIQAYVKFRDLSKGYNNIIKNWKQDIILDFQLVGAGAECPTDYKNEFVFNYGGAMAGCDCEQITPAQNITQIMYTQACNSTQTQVGCIDKREVPAIDFKSWAIDNVALNSRVICTKRKKGTTFISESTKLSSEGTCQTGSIECGSSAAVDPSRLKAMCISQEVAGCPVMDISSTGPPPSPGGSAAATSNVQIHWSKVPQGTGDLPISELALGFENVCKNINDKPREPQNVGNYKLRRSGSNTQLTCEGGIDLTFVPFH